MEAIGLREEYEHLRSESSRRRQALEWLLRTRDTVPGAYSVNFRPKGADGLTEPSIGQQSCFSSVVEPHFMVSTTGPKDWDKGEFWPIKARDVPRVCAAIRQLAHLEGTAGVRLQDQAVFTTWCLNNASRRLVEEQQNRYGELVLAPRKALVESRWLKFGEFSEVAFRVYAAGDACAPPGHSTVFVWMAHPPGISFTFNLRFGQSMHTAPRLWQATMIHFRQDVRWPELAGAIEEAEGGGDRLPVTLQVLQWHGPDDNPADSPMEVHTNVSLALEMLQGAAAGGTTAVMSQPRP